MSTRISTRHDVTTGRKSITQWEMPTDKVDSGYGTIPYRKWCELERKRLAKHGVHVDIVECGRLIALCKRGGAACA